MNIRAAKPEDAPGIARVHVDSWRTTYKGIVSQSYLDTLSYERREAVWRAGLSGDPTINLGRFNLVAEDPVAGIVGFAGGDRVRHDRGDYSPFAGELYAIYLLEEHQRKGLGTKLTRALAGLLEENGMLSMLLWALEANPARRFYERLGGVIAFRRDVRVGGEVLPEVAYGWTDITILTRD